MERCSRTGRCDCRRKSCGWDRLSVSEDRPCRQDRADHALVFEGKRHLSGAASGRLRMNMNALVEPLMALSAIFLPLLGCYALVEVQMSRKEIQPSDKTESPKLKGNHKTVFESANSLEFGRTRQYIHLCPVCRKWHFVNEARQRVAYGKQYSCSSECEAKRRKAWRHPEKMGSSGIDKEAGECQAGDVASDCLTTAHVGKLEQNDHLRRKQKTTTEES